MSVIAIASQTWDIFETQCAPPQILIIIILKKKGMMQMNADV